MDLPTDFGHLRVTRIRIALALKMHLTPRDFSALSALWRVRTAGFNVKVVPATLEAPLALLGEGWG